MKHPIPILLAAAFLPATSSAALLSQESFAAYGNGQLPALIPSPSVPGYTGNWIGVDFGDQRPAVVDGTLVYADPNYQAATGKKVIVPFNTTGGEITAANSGRCFRLFDSTLTVTDATADTRYLSFLFQTGKETGGTTYQTLALYNTNTADANRLFEFGIYGGANYQFSVNGIGSTTATPTDTGTHLVVVKFVTSAAADSDTVTVWVDPDLSAGEPTTGGTTVTGRNLRWDRLVFSDYEGNSAAWDEIRWGTTFNSVTTDSFFPAIPEFVTQPTPLINSEVDFFATLTAEAVANPAVSSYQWEKSANGTSGWTAIPGATDPELVIDPLAFSDNGFYRVIATNTNGSATSNTSQLVVVYPDPFISQQPQGAVIEEGGSVTLSVFATGLGNLSYQWFKDGNPLPGEDSDILEITNATLADTGTYFVEVTDDAPLADGQPVVSVDSNPASVEVFPAWEGLVSEEPFDTASGYVLGELQTQNPTITGYSGPWTDIDFGDAEPAVTSGSLSIPNPFYLGSSGEKITVASNTVGGEINAANSGRVFRLFESSHKVTSTTTGTRYLSFLFQSGQETGPTTYQTLALYNGNTADSSRAFDFGFIGNATQYNFGVFNNVSSTGVNANTATRLIVVKFDLSDLFGSDSVTVWVDPIIGNGEPTSGGTTVSNVELLWDRIAFSDYDGNSAAWDELRWGSTFNSVTVLASGLPSTPVFAIQPTNTNGNVGGLVTLTSSAVADPAITGYQWEKSIDGVNGWTPISGATAATLTFNPAVFANNGFYRAIATNPNASAPSEVAQVTITYPPPLIVQQPLPAGVSAGSNATFSVTAFGIGSLSYQWKKDGDDIPGETSSSLTITNVDSGDEGDYSVVITDSAAIADGQAPVSLESEPANLTVWTGLVSYEPFDTTAGYTLGELPAQNPAVTGYTGAWTDVDFGDAEPAISAGSLPYADPLYLGTAGDKVTVATNTDGGEINGANSGRVFRTLAPALQANANSSGPRYLSFLFQSGQETGATVYQTLALYNSDTADANRFFDIGITNNSTEYNFSILNSVTSTGVAANTSTRLIVVKFNLTPTPGGDSVTVWVDPTLGGGEPVSGNSTTVTGVDLNWDRIAFSDYDGNSAAWDELRWGSTFDSVTLNPNPPADFAAWISGFPGVGTLTGFNDDPDGDGIANGLENVFGTNPSVSNASINFLGKVGDFLTFQHPQTSTLASDISFEYVWTTDLLTWNADGAEVGGTTVTFATFTDNNITDGFAQVTGTIPDKVFISVRATQETP
jgi:hypothetical protein